MHNDKHLTIDPKFISLFDYREKDWYKEHPEIFHLQTSNNEFWEIGKHYLITPPTCEGFSIESSEYELKGIIAEYDGIPIDSVIVKKIQGPEAMRYTISKYDCEIFGIVYEPQLELLPMSLNWTKMQNNSKSFQSNDFSTMPVNPNTGLIHAFVIKLHGFEPTSFGENLVYIQQFDSIANIQALTSNIKVTSKYNLRNADKTMSIWHPYDSVNDLSTIYYIFDETGFYLVIDITPNTDNCEVNPKDLQGIDINDILNIEIQSKVLTPLELYQKQIKERKELNERTFANEQLKQQLKRVLQLQWSNPMPQWANKRITINL